MSIEDHKLIQLSTQLRATLRVSTHAQGAIVVAIEGWERLKDGMRGGGIGRGKTIEEAMEDCYKSLRDGVLVRGSGEYRKEVVLIEVKQ